MPFMTNGKRDYKKESSWEKEHKNGKRIRDRRARNSARYSMIKAGKVSRNDGKDVDHVKPLDSGGGNNASNLRVVSRKANAQKEVKRKRSVKGNN